MEFLFYQFKICRLKLKTKKVVEKLQKSKFSIFLKMFCIMFDID